MSSAQHKDVLRLDKWVKLVERMYIHKENRGWGKNEQKKKDKVKDVLVRFRHGGGFGLAQL